MKVCVLGAGALGSAIGGTLAMHGVDVCLINRNQAHIDAIRKNGLTLYPGSALNKPFTIRVQAQTDCLGIGEADLILVLVKSSATASAIEHALPLIGKNTAILSLQNGLGNEETILTKVTPHHLLGGRTYIGGMLLKPGHVVATTLHKLTRIGELNGSHSPRLETIKQLFENAGMPTEISDNIVGEMWDKLLVNVATGAISGLTRLTYGDMYAMPEIEALACAAVEEGIAVAQANGVRLSSTTARDIWLKASAGLPPEFKTSMLQSLEKGNITEIDFINGAVVRHGHKKSIPTPVNQALVACIKGLEKSIKNRASSS